MLIRAAMDPDLLTPAAPPTVPGPIGQPIRSTWPQVLGVIGLVFGMLGFLGGAWGVVATLLMRGLFPIPDEMRQWQATWQWWMVTSGGVSLALGVLLFAAALGLLARARWGVRLMVLWGILRALWALCQGYGTLLMMRDQMRAMSSSGAAMPAVFTNAFGAIGALLALVWGFAPAIFVLVWFARDRIRRETAAWK